MQWTVHGERSIYTSEWMDLNMVDVEIPGDRRFEHHVVRFPNPAAGTVIHHPDRGILLLWRHRFVTDTWGWELPAGGADPGESLEDAAVREADRRGGMASDRPTSHADATTRSTVPSTRPSRCSSRRTPRKWVRPPTPVRPSASNGYPSIVVRDELRAGRVTDGMSVTGLLWALQFEIGPA